MKKNWEIAIASSLIVLLVSYILLTSTITANETVDKINQVLTTSPSSSGEPVFNLLDAAKFTESTYPWIGFPITVLTEKELIGEKDNTGIPPNEQKVKQVFIKHKDEKKILINMASWQLSFDKEDDVLTELHIKWYQQLINWAKDSVPEIDIGIFGLPLSPWKALKARDNMILNYQKVNESMKPLIDSLDTLYPAFKIIDYEKSDFYYLMGTQLYIAKTFGKPVYPVISHRSTGEVSGFNKLIPTEYIKQQCTFIRKNADGMVWWTEEIEAWEDRWYDAVAEQCFL
jgi:hypothetical protein